MSTVDNGRTRAGDWQLHRWWRHADPWCRLLVVHGLNEHSGRYEHVGARISAEGVEVHGFDQRGFGRTWGTRSDVESFTHFVDDVEDRLAALREAEPRRPVALLGHSMGGLVAVTYCLDGRPLPDALVTTGAWLRSFQPGWQMWLAPRLARVLPTVRPRRPIDPDALSRDPAVGDAYTRDPLVNTGITARLAAEVFATQDRLAPQLGQLPVPSLHLHGAEDRLVPPEATEPLAASRRSDRFVYDGMRHELMNEIGWEGVVDRIVDWLRIELT